MEDLVRVNIQFLLSLLAGLGLVIFGMRTLASGFQVVFSRPIQYLINTLSSSAFVSVVVGVVNSFFIQSGFSSSMMSLSYAGAGLLSLRQLILLLLGSGLGTVATTWLFLLPTEGFDMYLIAAGVLPMMYSRAVALSALGKITFSFGLIFLGYNMMLLPVSNMALLSFQAVTASLAGLSPLSTFVCVILLVILLAVLLRSTVALIALTMALAVHDIIPTTLCIMVAVSVNLGRTIPILISSLSSSLTARRGAICNTLMNLFGVILVALFFESFYLLTKNLTLQLLGQSANFAMIPMAHLLFNIIVVVFSFIMIVPMKWVIVRVLPDKPVKEPQQLKFIGRTTHMAPILAIEQVYQEIKKMAATCETTLELTSLYLSSQEDEIVGRVLKYEKVTDNLRKEMFEFMAKVMEVSLSVEQGEQVRALLRMADELEGIADRCKQILLSKKEIHQIGVPAEGVLNDNIKKAVERLKEVYEMTFWQIAEPKSNNSQEYRNKLRQFDQHILELKKDYLNWVKSETGSKYQEEASLKYGDILFAIQQIRGRSQNLFEAYRYGYL